MKARIVDNLLEVIEKEMGEAEGHRNDKEFLELCERIQGKIVDLVFCCGDAFEKIDNNYWLPDCCWKEVTEELATIEDLKKKLYRAKLERLYYKALARSRLLMYYQNDFNKKKRGVKFANLYNRCLYKMRKEGISKEIIKDWDN